MTELERIIAKIVTDHATLRDQLAARKRVVVTKGVYDLLHSGHVRSFAYARELGDSLVVAVSTDRAVRVRKGPSRPIVGEGDRLLMVAAVQCVDWVTVYDDVSPFGVLNALSPAVFTASHFGSLTTEERAILRQRIEFVELPKRGVQSTTDIINALKRSHAPQD
jgi:rfaE bifunctional protein nucleotidyltransferase chain/domain